MDQYLSRILASAATQAQTILGESFTLAGETYKGVVTTAPEFIPGPNGIERVDKLSIVATKGQFDTAPAAVPRVAVSLGGQSYWCTAVDDDDLHYFLTCVPA